MDRFVTLSYSRLQDFKTLFLSLEARKILRSRKWQTHTHTHKYTHTQWPRHRRKTHPIPPPPPPPRPPLHPPTHTRKHVSTPVCRCENISTTYHRLRTTWSAMGEQKNTTWKMQLGQDTQYRSKEKVDLLTEWQVHLHTNSQKRILKHIHRHTHTRRATRAHPHPQTHAHPHTRSPIHLHNNYALARKHTPTLTHTLARARAHVHTHTHTHTHTLCGKQPYPNTGQKKATLQWKGDFVQIPAQRDRQRYL